MNEMISVITICYNAAKVLPFTMESVLAQDLKGFEYIIEDGASTDETSEIVESYREKFESKGIRFIYRCEPDRGIYDAMNKGVAASTGEYVNFMNAGDCFYGPGVLKHVAGVITAARLNGRQPAVVYGDCAMYEYGRFYLFQKSPERIEETMPFSHQSVFADRKLLLEHPFNTKYRYSADYDFLLTMHDLKKEFLDADTVICIATADGLTSVHYRDTLMESAAILKAHGVFSLSESEFRRKGRILLLKQFVLDHFPVSIKKIIRNRQIASRGQDFSPVIPDWFSDHIR